MAPLSKLGDFRAVILALAALVAFGLVLWVASSLLDLAERIARLPLPLQVVYGVLVALCAAAVGVLLLQLRPRPKTTRLPLALERSAVEQRIDMLDARGGVAVEARAELAALTARQSEAAIRVALYGQISHGKTSLWNALVEPQSPGAVDVRGGTTRTVADGQRGALAGRALIVSDLPGFAEPGGEHLATQAQQQARRAHLILYVAEGDLSRAQIDALLALKRFATPLVLVVNKADRLSAPERALLRKRFANLPAIADLPVAMVNAGFREQVLVVEPGGKELRRNVDHPADLSELQRVLEPILSLPLAQLDHARDQAMLLAASEQVLKAEQAHARAVAEQIVERYTQRAVVGALAAVAPGSDLLIQGALATGMIRELAGVHGHQLGEIEIKDLLKAVEGRLRTRFSVLLAIVGNALKAFPGVGTLAGGLVHAIAYGLIFNALGTALAQCLADRQRLESKTIVDQLTSSVERPDPRLIGRLLAHAQGQSG